MYLFQKFPYTENNKYSLLKKRISFELQVGSKISKSVSIYRYPSQTSDDFEKRSIKYI